MTPRKSFILLTVGLEWVTTIFQVPFVVSLFGFVVLWVVIGFRTAIGVSLLGSIPSFIESASSWVGVWAGLGSTAQNSISIVSTCASPNSTLYNQCVRSHFDTGPINWLLVHLPKVSTPSIGFTPTPFESLIFVIAGLVFYVLVGGGTMFFAIRKLIRFKRRLKQQLGRRYTFNH